MVNLRLNIKNDFDRNSQISFMSRFNRDGFICYKCNNKINDYEEITKKAKKIIENSK